tara:strand:+ start:1515 stop:1859 length:345 start_codon:yes stop_codon:yes gene_type:complete
MINNFENFSWDYNPSEDPYAKRAKSCSHIGGTGESNVRYEEVIFFNQLEDALMGVVEYSDRPPVACYSSSISLSILQNKHGLSEEDAQSALSQLIDSDLGPSAPCFLDTSIVEK